MCNICTDGARSTLEQLSMPSYRKIKFFRYWDFSSSLTTKISLIRQDWKLWQAVVNDDVIIMMMMMMMSVMHMINITTGWMFSSCQGHSIIGQFSGNAYQRNNRWFGIQIYKLCDSNGYLYDMKVNNDNNKANSDTRRVVSLCIG
jgi:hypothetical protein